jgi:hypothetical protein
MKILRTLAVTLPLVLASCSSDDNPVEAHGLNNIRATAISEAAVSYGAQYALAWRASTIQKTLVKAY